MHIQRYRKGSRKSKWKNVAVKFKKVAVRAHGSSTRT